MVLTSLQTVGPCDWTLDVPGSHLAKLPQILTLARDNKPLNSSCLQSHGEGESERLSCIRLGLQSSSLMVWLCKYNVTSCVEPL